MSRPQGLGRTLTTTRPYPIQYPANRYPWPPPATWKSAVTPRAARGAAPTSRQSRPTPFDKRPTRGNTTAMKLQVDRLIRGPEAQN